MRFDVIPALDVAGGRLARITEGGVERVGAFGGDPVAAAEFLVASGVRWLHLVDVDLALTGVAANLGILRAVAALGVPVQSSGGIKTVKSVGEALQAGADRVVLGSAALDDRRLVEALVSDEDPRVAVGLEVDAGRIRSRGAASLDLPLEETLDWLAALPLARLMVTALPKVGGLDGPDLSAVRSVSALGKPVIAAGGISSIEHIESVRRIGAEAVVIGRAFVEGNLELRAALACQA